MSTGGEYARLNASGLMDGCNFNSLSLIFFPVESSKKKKNPLISKWEQIKCLVLKGVAKGQVYQSVSTEDAFYL